MNWWDRELLQQVAEADKGLDYFVLELLHHSEDGGLPAEGMRVLGKRYTDLGAKMLTRAEQLLPGQTRWWRSKRDLRVHAWPVPLQAPYQRRSVCGHTVWASNLTRDEDGEPCFDCAAQMDELHRIPRWARELPRTPRSPGPTR